MIPISRLKPHSHSSKKAALSWDVLEVLKDRKVDIGSETQLVRSFPRSLSDSQHKRGPIARNTDRNKHEMSVNTNSDEPSVELMLGSNSETDPRRTSFDRSIDCLWPKDDTGDVSGEEELWCISARVLPNTNGSINLSTNSGAKKDHVVRNGRTSLVLPTDNQSTVIPTSSEARNDGLDFRLVSLKECSQPQLQSLNWKVSPWGKILSPLRKQLLTSFNTSQSNSPSEANEKREIVRQAPFSLKDTYQAIMYGCDSHNSDDYFAPYAETNRQKIMSNTQLNNESSLLAQETKN